MGYLWLIFFAPFIVLNVWLYRSLDKPKSSYDGNGIVYAFFNFGLFFVMTLVCTVGLTKQVQTGCYTVVEIGGCGRYDCAVRLSDGRKHVASHPLIGDEVCYYETVPRFWEE